MFLTVAAIERGRGVNGGRRGWVGGGGEEDGEGEGEGNH